MPAWTCVWVWRAFDGWTMCAAACSTTGLSEVAMTPFVPHFSAFIVVCMYLGLCVEPQGFVLFSFLPSALLMPVSFVSSTPPHLLPALA